MPLMLHCRDPGFNAWFKSAGLSWWPLVTHPATSLPRLFFISLRALPPSPATPLKRCTAIILHRLALHSYAHICILKKELFKSPGDVRKP